MSGRILRRSLGAAIAGALLASAVAARADPPVWHVRGARSDVTLFGSVHVLSAATRWKTPALEQDLSRADQVWFEVPIDPAAQAEAAADALKLGTLPPDQSLPALLGPATTARVEALAASEKLPAAALQRMKPWMAELMLSTLYYQQSGADPTLGVEEQLAHDAPPSAVREAFETVPEQLHLFADDPTPDQIASLKQTLGEIADDPGLFARLVAEWARGDTVALTKDVITPMQRDTPGLYDRLLVARNRRFTARIEQMLAGSQRVFVVVGVGHLIGPDSVPAMLRRDGVAVQGP